ncbi:VanW family protein [Paenibacillus sp. FA6]|uniref:VanW family protein n=1 Tax=Paenibacillus sp. FA6 TaxID=3413029 RepID=UPI003F65B9AC
MKNFHIILIIVTAIVIIGSTLFGSLYLYSQQDKLPKGTILSGWVVGGLTTEIVLQELDDRIHRLEQLPLHITINNPSKSIAHSKWTLADAGVHYEADDFRRAILKLREGNMFERIAYRWHFESSFVITSHWNPASMKSIYNEAWEKNQFGVPVNATRRITTNDKVVYTPEISAYRLDWKTLTNRMTSLIPQNFVRLEHDAEDPLTCELPFTLERPMITIEDLKDEGIERKIMEFSTHLRTSGQGRVFNVNSAAQATNGMILKPGEVFDYGKVIALAEKQYGFREAPVILNGKLVPGIGGGICQVSSTLYSAAIRTGLDIVERRSHSLPVSYLPKGQDATFATGSINFRFKNNTGKYLLIQAIVIDRTLTVKFFGTFPKNIRYDIESIVVETLTSSNKYVKNSTLPVGAQEVLQNGTIGYVVDTYQIKKVDGVVQQRIRISRDTYLPQKRIISIHPEEPLNIDTPTAPKEKQIIEDGVSGPNF